MRHYGTPPFCQEGLFPLLFLLGGILPTQTWAEQPRDLSQGGLNHSKSALLKADFEPSAAVMSSTGSKVPLMAIFFYTLLMALASGLGALPFFMFGRLKPYWAGIANAVAVGVMLAASFDLLHEGAPHSPSLTILGMVIGALFIKASQDFLSQFEDATFEDLQGADARKAMLIIAVMAAHAFGEGSGVGVSFSGQRGWAKGLLVTIAIGLHNVPEGMAVAGVMMSKGSSPAKALYWTLLCSLPQALVSVPSFLFVETFTSLLPVALGFAAGCMVWIAFAELLPDALEAADHGHVATAATFSAAWLQGLSMLIATLEQIDGSLASPIQNLSVAVGAAAGAIGWIAVSTLLTIIWINRLSMSAAIMSALGGACMTSMILIAMKKAPKDNESSEDTNDIKGGQIMGNSIVPAGNGHPWSYGGGGHIEGLPAKHSPNKNDYIHSISHCQPYARTAGPLMQNHSWNSTEHPSCPPGYHDSLMSKAFESDMGLPQYEEGISGPVNGKASASFATVIFMSQGLLPGLALAQAVASGSSTLSCLMSSALSAVPVGVACGGLGRALSGAGWRMPLAISMGLVLVSASTVTCLLAGLPLGKESGSMHLDVMSWSAPVEAAISGSLLLVAWQHVWPLACLARVKKAKIGLMVALSLGTASSLLHFLLLGVPSRHLDI